MLSFLFGLVMVANVAAPDAPAHEPQLAVSGSKMALAFGAGNAIFSSISEDSGKTFSSPVKVSEASVVPLTRHRGPRIAFSGEVIVISAVVGKTLADGPHAHGLPSDGDLIAWRSVDGGKSWTKGVVINDVPGASTEGLHSLAADTQGNLFAAWLDKRGGQGTKLYGARSTDAGRTWSKNVMIYDSPEGTICQCCHPSVAIDGQGQILVMWRNWLAGSRDMYLVRSSDGIAFSLPEKLGRGTWPLNACPMDGGGMAASANGIVTAWRREHSIYLDRPGEPEREIGQGTDVAVAAGKDGTYAIWSTPASIELLSPARRAPQSLHVKGAFPAIAPLPKGGAIAAWEADGKISLQFVR